MSVDQAIAAIPDGWFLHHVGEAVKRITYAKDQHEPFGYWNAELQHRGGGRLTTTRGLTPALAIANAVATVNAARPV